MKNKTHSANFQPSSLNTLAENGTAYANHLTEKPAAIICGQGSELGNAKLLQGRAKRKMIAQVMALSLVNVAEKKENSEAVKSFWNTYHCQSKLICVDGRYYGTYCKNRFCPLCSSIRKADIINRYMPVLQTWEAPQFVTLSIRTMSKAKLAEAMKTMIERLNRIVAKYKKRGQRGTGIKLIGIRALESTYNPVDKKYHPHFHIIVANKEMAAILIREWLEAWKKNYWAGRRGQYVRPVRDLERDLVETVKYGSKIFTEPDITKKTKTSGDNSIYAAAHYNIFEAMKGLRIFERFGFNLPKGSKTNPVGARVVREYSEWIFLPEYHDWQNVENELVLTAYNPPSQLQRLLDNNIDMVSE